MSFTQIYYHIIFSTKDRIPCLVADKRKDIYNYLWGVLKNKRCFLHRMNGLDDHIHMLVSLHPTVALADLIRDLKTASTAAIRREKIIRDFPGWQSEYAAFTKSHADRGTVIEYIRNQEEHHKIVSFREELIALLKEEGIVFDEKYLK